MAPDFKTILNNPALDENEKTLEINSMLDKIRQTIPLSGELSN